MAARSPDVEELILRIHAAVLAEDGWSRIAKDLCQAVGAHSGSFVRPSHNADAKPWTRFVEIDPNAVKDYADHWGHHDVWYHGALRAERISVGLVSRGDQLIERREFERSAFYNEYLKALNIDRMMNVCVISGESSAGHGPAALSLYRGVGKEPFSDEQAELLCHLAPHLTVATHNYWAARSLELTCAARDRALNAVNSAVFVLDSSGRPVYANQPGEELIRQERWVRLERGLLSPTNTLVDGARITAALHRACLGVGCKIMVTDGTTTAQAYLCAAPLPATEHLFSEPSDPWALVWITPITPPEDTSQDMALLFRLTPAEKRLLRRLIAGDELGEAAAGLRLSIHTARTQLKSIFRKTGRRTQSQLLLLAARVATLSLRPAHRP
jgi:DNA-binding CsgD family transcriptional regulator/PAS domain-containing protein